MSKLLCDECPKKGCDKRVAGAVCSFNEGTQSLIKAYKTRDPEMIIMQVVGVLAEEAERYKDARDNEKIGETETKTIIDEMGRERTVISERKVNPAISRIADGIFKNTKIMNDIINPKKSAPMFQKNTQINVGGSNVVADDLRSLDESEKDSILKFIDAKLDEKDN